MTHPGHFGQDQRRERHLRSFNDASANRFVTCSGSEVAVRCHVYLFGCCYLYGGWGNFRYTVFPRGAPSSSHQSTFNREVTSNRCHSSGQPLGGR